MLAHGQSSVSVPLLFWSRLPLLYLEVLFIWEFKVSLQICLPRESYNSAKIDVNCLQKHVNTIQGGQKIDEFSKMLQHRMLIGGADLRLDALKI